MRRVLVAALLLSLIQAPAVAAAAQPAQEEQAGADVAEKLISAYYKDFYAKKFDQALADIKDLNPDPSNKEGRAVLDAMRATAMLGLKRDKEADRLIARIRELSSGDPTADSILFNSIVWVDHFEVAADALDDMIARFPDAARDLDQDMVRYFLNWGPSGDEPGNQDRRIALARIGYGGDTKYGHRIAYDAVNILVGRGDASEAADLLRYASEPQYFENMLIQKRFASLWPMLEQIGGPHIDKVRESTVETAGRAYLSAPDDYEKLAAYVEALREAGRLDDAIAFRAKLPKIQAEMSSADEDMGWAVNSVAVALHEAGRREEADQLFALLNDAPIVDGGWRVNMMINRLDLLVTTGQYAKAAPLLGPTEQIAKTHGSAYAQQAVRRLQYCTMSSLGRKEEAQKLLPEMMRHAGDAVEATVDGLICAGEIDKAERLVVETLEKPDTNHNKWDRFEEDFVRALQPVPLTSDDPSIWQGQWAELRKRPAIAKEFARLGRDMPVELLAKKRPTMVAK